MNDDDSNMNEEALEVMEEDLHKVSELYKLYGTIDLTLLELQQQLRESVLSAKAALYDAQRTRKRDSSA